MPEIARLIGPPEADGEYIALRDASGATGASGASGDSGEEVVHLHDYERLYRVPGLYEHVVQDLLQCRSPQVAADGLAYALARLGIDPAETVLLDVGAGTGIVGELVTTAGVPCVIGIDALEAARTACLRDRPGVYRDYLVGDLAVPRSDLLTRLRRHRPTALISAGAMGGGTHMPPPALVNALSLMPGGAPVVFTIGERWMNTDDPGGFKTPMAELTGSGALRILRRTRFQHRLSTTRNPIHYELLVTATGRDEAPLGAGTS